MVTALYPGIIIVKNLITLNVFEKKKQILLKCRRFFGIFWPCSYSKIHHYHKLLEFSIKICSIVSLWAKYDIQEVRSDIQKITSVLNSGLCSFCSVKFISTRKFRMTNNQFGLVKVTHPSPTTNNSYFKN